MRHSPQEIFNTAARWLEATGSTPYEARVVADHLTNANLRGHDSHGVGMIAMYAQYLNEGKLIPNAPLNVIKDTGPVLQLDGFPVTADMVSASASKPQMQPSNAPSKTASACTPLPTPVTLGASAPMANSALMPAW